MFSSTRAARAFLSLAALSLAGCTSLLGDFSFDPNAKGSGGNGGISSNQMQGEIVVMPTTGLITTEQGAKATFTIALKHKPTANVAIALSSSNPKEGVVSPISVSFTPDNFDAPQVVQVTGVDDNVPDGTQTYTIKTSLATSEDKTYLGIDPIDPEVRNVDDETAGFLLMPPSGLVTTESGGEATFTLALTHAPTADVVIPLSSDKLTEGTVSPAGLTFTALNWMAPQLVTVTGVNDDAADGPQTFHVVTGPAMSTDQGYDKLDPDDETVINQDNDSAGITLMPATGLVTFENGAMTTFSIVLNSPPSKDVLIPLESSDQAEGTVAPDHVLFTPLNWMAPQVITVTGVDDERSDGNRPYKILTDAAQSDDPGYAGFNGPDAELTNIDDDSPGLVVTPTTGLVTKEDGSATTFTVALASKPSGDVVLGVQSSRPTEGVAAPAKLTFTEVNWDAPQTVTVKGVDDKAADGMQTYVVHVTPDPTSVDGSYAALLETDVNLSNTDDDSAGITVVAQQGLTTTETGGSATFTIALNSQPSADVSIALTSSDTTEGTVTPAQLVFTHDNYNAPQTVTVKGVNDDMQDGNQPYRIITEPAVSNDPGYAGMNATNVDLTNTDDDSAGITVSAPNQPLVTSESGGSATFTVVLNSQPASEVNIPVSSSKTSEGTVNVSNLKFTLDNWRAPQTITVKGVEDDGTADGSQQYRVRLDAAVSADPNYNGMNPLDVKVTNTDNDTAGITLKNTNNLTTKEDGSMTTFQVVLNSKPTADVTIGLSSSRTTEGVVTPGALKFTGANWNAPQSVTITGVDDKVADGSQIYRVLTAPAVSTDPNYNDMDPADPNVTNVDNDSAGISVVYAPPTGLSTKEGGGTASFTIALNSQPTADVTIALHSSKTTEGTVGPASLTFTAANWNAPRTVTVTGADDKVADGAQPYTIVIDPAVSTDPKYNGIDAPDVPASNIDNDSAGITVGQVSGNTKENGSTASFTIVLNSEPKADVSIALSSTDKGEGVVSPASITFTALNWNAPQKITITGVDDKVADGAQPYSIVTDPASSKDPGYNGIDPDDVTLTNVDDDSAGITVSAAKGKTSEGGGTTSFSIVLNSQPTADVTIPLSSSNTNEGTLALTQVVFTTSDYGSPKTVTITGVDDASADGDQPYSIVVGAAVSADKGYSGMDPADVAVTNVDNDSAGLSVSASQGTTSEKGASAAFTFTIALTSKPSADVTVPLSSSDSTEGTVSPTSLTFTSSNWNAGQTVTVTGVNDDVADGPQVYAIQIDAATSADKGYSGFDYPSDVAMTNIDDDSAGIEVSKAAGSTSEKGATTTFTIVLSSKPTASVTIPLASSDVTEGTLTISSVTFTTSNWSSPQTVTVHGENDKIADGSQGYTIQTGPAMSADAGYDGIDADDVDVINIDDDVAGIQVSAADGPTSEAGGKATFTVVLNSQPTAAVSIPLASNNTDEGKLAVTKLDFTTSNWSAPQTVTVTGVDDSVADGPQNYSIVLGTPSSADAAYAAIDPDDVALINTDNDSAGVTVSDALDSISETGTSTTFEIVLDSQPKANVVIPLSVSDDTEAKLQVASVTFTSSNWQTPKKVTVTGVDDDVADGAQMTTVVTGVVVSDDPGYAGKDPKDVAITTLDNDSAGVEVTAPSMSFTGESPSVPSVKFSVVLSSAPSASVVILLTSSNTDEGVISSPLNHGLVFDSTNWNKPQFVTVTGVQDLGMVDGDQPYSIDLASSSDDAAYNGLTLSSISLINLDDDGP